MKLSGTKEKLISDLVYSLESGKNYDIEVKEPSRTLTANAYYWQLLHQYAVYEKRSDAYIHNGIIARFGEDMTYDGQVLYVVIPDDERWRENMEIHLRPTSEVRIGTDGKTYRTFIQRAGSRTYSKRQFSRLIDGLIEDIKGSEAPIQTMTPSELERLKGYEADA